jgi:uncharacterized protein with PIN domain
LTGASDRPDPVSRTLPEVRFATDTSLELLARRLRLLGYDVLTCREARLEDVLEVARRDGRTVLTSSLRRPRPFADVPCLTVPREEPARAVRAIAENFRAPSPPFSRCPACNHALEKRMPMEARGEVPGGVLRVARSVQHCRGCGKWFWRGSHVDRMRAWLAAALGREVPWVHDRPDDR